MQDGFCETYGFKILAFKWDKSFCLIDFFQISLLKKCVTPWRGHVIMWHYMMLVRPCDSTDSIEDVSWWAGNPAPANQMFHNLTASDITSNLRFSTQNPTTCENISIQETDLNLTRSELNPVLNLNLTSNNSEVKVFFWGICQISK